MNIPVHNVTLATGCTVRVCFIDDVNKLCDKLESISAQLGSKTKFISDMFDAIDTLEKERDRAEDLSERYLKAYKATLVQVIELSKANADLTKTNKDLATTIDKMTESYELE